MQPGSGKSTLCNKLSDNLGWKVNSIGGLFRARYEEWKKDNKYISFEKYWASVVTNKEIYEVNDEAREMLVKGGVILDSRYAAVNAFGLNDCLLVFVKAPLAIRVKRNEHNLRYKGKSLDDIEELLSKREENEVRRGRELYGHIFDGFDYRDERLYDLILDTSKLTVDEEVASVLNYLKL